MPCLTYNEPEMNYFSVSYVKIQLKCIEKWQYRLIFDFELLSKPSFSIFVRYIA